MLSRAKQSLESNVKQFCFEEEAPDVSDVTTLIEDGRVLMMTNDGKLHGVCYH